MEICEGRHQAALELLDAVETVLKEVSVLNLDFLYPALQCFPEFIQFQILQLTIRSFSLHIYYVCTSDSLTFLRHYYVFTPYSLQANIVEDANHPSLRSLVRLRLLDFCSTEGGAISKAAKVTFFNNFGPWFDPLISMYTEQVMHLHLRRF